MADNGARILITADDAASPVFEKIKQNFGGIQASALQLQGVMGTVTAALTAVGATALVHQAGQVYELEDSLYKMSQRTGVAVESLSTLRYAADLSGVKIEDLDGLLVKLNKTLAAAGGGDVKTAQFLRQFGISAEDVRSGVLGTDEALKRIADTFASAPDGINKTAAATELFGKSGAAMIAFLNQGRQGMEDLQDEARRLGLQIESGVAKQAERLNDNLRTLSFASEGLRVAFFNGLLEPLSQIVQAMRDATIEGGKFQGVIAGLRTFLTGGDQFKNDKELVELTEKKLRLEQDVANFRGRGLTFRAQTSQKELDEVNARIQTTLTYRKELETVAAAEKAAAEAAEKRRQSGKQLEPKSKVEGIERDPLKPIFSFVDQVGDRLNTAIFGEFDTLRRRALEVFDRVDIGRLNPEQFKKFADAFAEVNDQIDELERRANAAASLRTLVEGMNLTATATQAANDALAGFNTTQSQALQDLEFEAGLVGKLAAERTKLTALRRIELDTQRAIAAVPENADDREARIEGIIALSQTAKERTSELYDTIREKGRDAYTGLYTASAEYVDRVTNDAKSVQDAFTSAFQGMEDALVQFTTTGKLDFKKLADSIVADIARITIRQNITAPLAQQLGNINFGNLLSGDFGFGTGARFGNQDFGGFFASGGRPPVGLPSIVGERGPELFVPDVAGTVVPNGALGGSVSINQSINVDSRSDRASVVAAMVAAKEAAKAEILDSMNRGGAFRRAA